MHLSDSSSTFIDRFDIYPAYQILRPHSYWGEYVSSIVKFSHT
jgi:hypothetical protein